MIIFDIAFELRHEDEMQAVRLVRQIEIDKVSIRMQYQKGEFSTDTA
jgi:hypothetical protein